MRSRGLIFTIITSLSILLTLLYLLNSAQKVDEVGNEKSLDLFIKAIPEEVQVVLYGDANTPILDNEALFDSFTSYLDFLRYWQESSCDGYFLYGVRVEFDRLDGAFILPYSVGNALLVQDYIKKSYPYASSDNFNDTKGKLFADGLGNFITYLESEDIICFGSDYSLVELLEQTSLVEQPDSTFQKEVLKQLNVTGSSLGAQTVFYRPNIVPLGRKGVSSLEEYTTSKWLTTNVLKGDSSLSFHSYMPTYTDVNNNQELSVPVSLNVGVPISTKLVSYYGNSTMLAYLSLPIDVKSTRLENLWNSSLSAWLSSEATQGVFVYYLEDSIMESEKLIRIPLLNISRARESLQRLLSENQMVYKSLLREETIQGYWKIDVMPAIFGLQQLAEVSRDRRLLYYRFTDKELLLAFNYNLLFNYLTDIELINSRCLHPTILANDSAKYSILDNYFWASLAELAADSISDYPAIPSVLLQDVRSPYLYLEGGSKRVGSSIELMYKFSNKLAIEHN